MNKLISHFFVCRRLSWIVLAALAFAGISAGKVNAATTQRVTSAGARVHIAASAPKPDGTVRAAVIIDLKPGWTTYWRNPGESGIPPRLSTKGSTNLASAVLAFPAPTAISEAGLKVIGYDHSVALPLTLRQNQPGAATTVNAHLFIGVCKDICIPMKAELKLVLPAATGSGNRSGPDEMQVRLAYARLPEPESSGFMIKSAALSSGAKALNVAVRLPGSATGTSARLFAAGPDAWVLGVARLSGTSGRTARFTVPVIAMPEGSNPRGVAVHFVVRDGGRAIAAMKSVE